MSFGRGFFDDFDSRGAGFESFMDGQFPSRSSAGFGSDFFDRKFDDFKSRGQRQRSPMFNESPAAPAQTSSFARRASPTTGRQSPGQMRSQPQPGGSAQKVHVIPITVEGRDQPVARPVDTRPLDRAEQPHQQPEQTSATSSVQQPIVSSSGQPAPCGSPARPASPSADQQHSEQQHEQPASSSPSQSARVIQIPIQVEAEPQRADRLPGARLPNFSDPHLPHLSTGGRPKCSTPGQKNSTGSRPQSASFSDLPSNQSNNVGFGGQPGSNKYAQFSPASPGAPGSAAPVAKPAAALSPLEKIQAIVEEVRGLEAEVEAFTGQPQDKQYRYLDEYLTRSLLKLDQVETNGNQEIRQERKQAITLVESVISKLEAAGRAATEKTADAGDEPAASSEETNHAQHDDQQ